MINRSNKSHSATFGNDEVKSEGRHVNLLRRIYMAKNKGISTKSTHNDIMRRNSPLKTPNKKPSVDAEGLLALFSHLLVVKIFRFGVSFAHFNQFVLVGIYKVSELFTNTIQEVSYFLAAFRGLKIFFGKKNHRFV